MMVTDEINQIRNRILLADDEPLYLRTTAELLRRAGYECLTATDAAEAIQALTDQSIDLIIVDLNMPGNLDLELLNVGRKQYPQIPMIVATGAPSLRSAIDSVRLHIADYLLKPIRIEELIASVRRALASRQITANSNSIPAGTGDPVADLLIGHSAEMSEIHNLIRKAGASEASVLITGESGTGKELAALALHRSSSRSQGSFITVDCTAIPEALFESVLFGHIKGAFTGAAIDQPGLLRGAHGGTIFLDEIGELPLSSQSKLLRFIQHATFTPVGQTQPISIDVRIIAATNRDLSVEVKQERFRQDLFYRLSVIPIRLPPLRNRGDDICQLADHFLRTLNPPQRTGMKLSAEALAVLQNYSWPGNVRELRNVIERVMALSTGSLIQVGDLPPTMTDRLTDALAATTDGASPRHRVLARADRGYLEDLLKKSGGNVSHAATLAGVTRQGMYKLLQKHGIVPTDFRS